MSDKPLDLQVVQQPDTNKDYFNFKATGLKIDKTYAIKFQWVYDDGTLSDWSPGYFINTVTETVPSAPTATVEGGAGFIKVSLPTFPTNALRVDVRISGGIFGDGTKVADSFTAAGTKTITAPGGAAPGFAYTVTLLTVTPSKINGDPTSATTVYVTDPTANLQIEPPTLASGLSVSSAPFAVAVNWAGTYSSSDFDGFKSIDIHVRGSDVGSTATAGFSSTTQVATLTVTGTTNRQNVGLDNLRQALGLANNTAAYTAPMFFYYITRNSQDALYSVSGTPTYTRINSSSVNPTQANFVDLANGVISIENLVAGNGNFSSYLRVGSSGTSGGARIELSGVDNFTDSNTTRIVKRGLTAYDSGNNEVLRFDYGATTPTLTIKGDGEFTGNLSIGSGNNIFKAQPATGVWLGHTSYLDAPFKVNTTGYLESTSGKIGGWTITGSVLESSDTLTTKISLNPATPKIALIQSGSEKITFDPVEGIVGPNITYGGQSVPSFKLTPSGNLTLYGSITVTGGNAATSDQVNSKNKTFYQNDEPTNPINGYSLVVGDLWFDTNDNNKQYRWDSTWQLVQDGTIAAAKTAADLAKAKADTSLQQGGNEVRNASNQITTINSTGITITGSTFSLNGSGTATTPAANSLVINSAGLTAKNASGDTTFYINASTGDAEFKGTIKSGSTITGAQIQTSTGSNRIVLDSVDDSIKFYSPAGGTPGSIRGDVYSINGLFGLMQIVGAAAPGHTAPTIVLYSLGTGSSNYGTSFSGTVYGVSGSSLSNSAYRNISAGTGSKTSSDTDGLLGDIWIQYS